MRDNLGGRQGGLWKHLAGLLQGALGRAGQKQGIKKGKQDDGGMHCGTWWQDLAANGWGKRIELIKKSSDLRQPYKFFVDVMSHSLCHSGKEYKSNDIALFEVGQAI